MNRIVTSVVLFASASSACRSIGDAPNATSPRGSATAFATDAAAPVTGTLHLPELGR